MLIQLCGKIGAGKSTVGGEVSRIYSTIDGKTVVNVPLAAALKREVISRFGVRKNGSWNGCNWLKRLTGDAIGSEIFRNPVIKDIMDGFIEDYPIVRPDLARRLLQTVGLLFRDTLGADYWCNIVVDEVNCIIQNHPNPDNLVFINDDYRFPNENLTGKVYCSMNTFRIVKDFDNAKCVLDDDHVSESHVNELDVNHEIYNSCVDYAASTIVQLSTRDL